MVLTAAVAVDVEPCEVADRWRWLADPLPPSTTSAAAISGAERKAGR